MNKYLKVLLLLCFSLPVIAQEADLEAMPGYVNFDSLSSVYGEPKVMINIHGVILQLLAAAAAASKDEPEAAALMRELKAVRVNVYSTEGVLSPAREQIARVKETLEKEAWQPVVQVKENREEVQIFMKADDSGMQGLTVMTVNGEEAVFINILGAINPQQLSVVMDKLNVDIDVDTVTDEE